MRCLSGSREPKVVTPPCAGHLGEAAVAGVSEG